MIASPKSLVEKYLQFFEHAEKNVTKLQPLLADKLHFKSPLGEFFTADSFLHDLKRDVLAIKTLDVQHILVDGHRACVLYQVHSNDPDIGSLTFSEWFEVHDGKISSIRSTYDASEVRKSMAQI